MGRGRGFLWERGSVSWRTGTSAAGFHDTPSPSGAAYSSPPGSTGRRCGAEGTLGDAELC